MKRALVLSAALLLMVGCDSITDMDKAAYIPAGAGILQNSSVSDGYTITLLPDGMVSWDQSFLVVDDNGGIFGSIVHSSGTDRAARWTADASGNVTGPDLLGSLPVPFDEAHQYVRFTSANGDVVVGYTQIDRPGPTSGWVWANGAMVLLPSPEDAHRVNPFAVNDAGIIVGQIGIGEDGDWGAVWLPPYEAQPILLPRLEGYRLNSARHINNHGVIAGWVRGINMIDALVQWRIDADGNVLAGPDKIEGSNDVLLGGANPDLDVVGSYYGVSGQMEPFLFRSNNAPRIDLGSLAGHSWGGASAITNRFQDGTVQIAGHSQPSQMQSSERRGVVWSVDGSNVISGPVALGLPEEMEIRIRPRRTREFASATAFSINGNGWVVGISNREDGRIFSTLWQPVAGGGTEPPSDAGPTASFDYSCGNSPTCQFTDTSTEGGAAILSKNWETGSQTDSGSPVSFTFGTAGDHVVTLTVTDADSESDQAIKTINCRDHPRHGLRCS
jgi:hypothetical protein